MERRKITREDLERKRQEGKKITLEDIDAYEEPTWNAIKQEVEEKAPGDFKEQSKLMTERVLMELLKTPGKEIALKIEETWKSKKENALKIEETWKSKKESALKAKPEQHKKANALKIQEPEKQKKQVRPRIKIVSRQRNEPEPSPDIPARLKNRILGELKGTGLRLVTEKPLHQTDLSVTHNRLSFPRNHVTNQFLTETEYMALESGGVLRVYFIEPSGRETFLNMTRWMMKEVPTYELNGEWNEVVHREENGLKVNAVVQLWSFRIWMNLCLALVKVRDGDEVDGANTGESSKHGAISEE